MMILLFFIFQLGLSVNIVYMLHTGVGSCYFWAVTCTKIHTRYATVLYTKYPRYVHISAVGHVIRRWVGCCLIPPFFVKFFLLLVVATGGDLHRCCCRCNVLHSLLCSLLRSLLSVCARRYGCGDAAQLSAVACIIGDCCGAAKTRKM